MNREIIYKYHNETQIIRDTIQGEFNRICVTHSLEELRRMNLNIRNNLDKLFDIKLKEISDLQEAEDESTGN